MIREALRTLFPIAGWEETRARAVEITGHSDPILPTPFRIGETGAAALAAVGLAVSGLWELRTGRRQEVAIDTRQATASLRSGHYMKLDGAPLSTERNTVMGVYPARNGRWSYLHCNFPNHRAAALGVLGVPEDREAVRKAVAGWDAPELEEAIIAAKGAGGMVRTMEEWAQHPQAAAIAWLPLMEIVRIGASPRTSRHCAGSSATRTCSLRATGRARWAIGGSRPRRWRNCGRASSSSRCAPLATSGHGRRAAASTRWCRPSAASPAARA